VGIDVEGARLGVISIQATSRRSDPDNPIFPDEYRSDPVRTNVRSIDVILTIMRESLAVGVKSIEA
jgi:hypothetical protein